MFKAADFLSMPNYSAYMRVLVHGEPQRPFSAQMLPATDEVPR